MNRKMKMKIVISVTLSLLAFNTNAALISDNFIRTGTSEQLVAPFTSEGGVQSVNAYFGFVEVIVSGVGNALSITTNDAFYGVSRNGSGDFGCVNVGVPIKDSCSSLIPTYQLGIGSENSPFTISGSNDAEKFITFIDSVGFVQSGTAPAYDSSAHTYHFVIDTSLLNISSGSLLTFGVTDDYYLDNGGEYLIDLYQVQAVPIPSPQQSCSSDQA